VLIPVVRGLHSPAVMTRSPQSSIMTDATRVGLPGAALLASVCLLAACGGDNAQQQSQPPAAAPAAADRAEGGAQPADAAPPPPAAAMTERGAMEPSPAPPGQQLTPPPRPAFREVTIPSGTLLPIVLDTAVASDTSKVEDAVRAHLQRPVSVGGTQVLPQGTDLAGVVVAAERPGKVKGRARVAFRLTSLRLEDERVDVRTSIVSRRAPATKKQDAAKIGIPAAGGAVVGAIIGGKKGAAIGGAAGGGAGTAVVLSTRGREIRVPEGSTFSVRLLEPITVRVPVG
jgi:hypothetical protein